AFFFKGREHSQLCYDGLLPAQRIPANIQTNSLLQFTPTRAKYYTRKPRGGAVAATYGTRAGGGEGRGRTYCWSASGAAAAPSGVERSSLAARRALRRSRRAAASSSAPIPTWLRLRSTRRGSGLG
uniref:Uncharacterized protein n=1 Tax=Aegilops tauschii subsp. strangulata TaxID=200361 RepID=A0A453TDT5_AEGTS